MSEAKHCPHCGAPLAIEGDHPPTEIATEAAPLENLDEDLPSLPLLAPGSNDDTFLASPSRRNIQPVEPDPLLGAFVEVGAPVGSSVSLDSGISQPVSTRMSGSSAIFPAINLDTMAGPPAPASEPAPTTAIPQPEDDEEEVEEPRSGWSSVLLASYASAVTIALVWFVMKDRDRQKPLEDVATPSSRGSQPPTNGDLSRKVPAPEPILGELQAKLGQPLKVGQLEITPLDVKRRDFKLQRQSVLAEPELRDGGKKALVLRLKLRNTSEESVFAPLDPAYLREQDHKLVDTFVTTASGERIYPYKLALQSEWSIVGQDLSELRPGESRTVIIATASDAPPDDAGPFTWRVRLRTGIDRTDVIGLTWPEPAQPTPPPTSKP